MPLRFQLWELAFRNVLLGKETWNLSQNLVWLRKSPELSRLASGFVRVAADIHSAAAPPIHGSKRASTLQWSKINRKSVQGGAAPHRPARAIYSTLCTSEFLSIIE